LTLIAELLNLGRAAADAERSTVEKQGRVKILVARIQASS
jgi:hypothetical protein